VTFDPIAITDFVGRAGVVGILVFILITGANRLWVFGYQLHEMQLDRDRWRDLSLSLLGQTKRSTEIAARSMSLAEQKMD